MRFTLPKKLIVRIPEMHTSVFHKCADTLGNNKKPIKKRTSKLEHLKHVHKSDVFLVFIKKSNQTFLVDSESRNTLGDPRLQ